MLKVLARNADFTVAGPIENWTNVEIVERFNEVGSWRLDFPAHENVRGLVPVGGGVIFVDDDRGEVIMSGPLEERPYNWSLDPGNDASGDGRLSLSGADDLALLAHRRAYPDPTSDATQGSGDPGANAYFTRTNVNAEGLLRDLVNLNAGSGAIADRQISNLVLGSVIGATTTSNVNVRFKALVKTLRSVALAGDLGFRVRQNGTEVEFQVYDPQDLTSTARFSRDLGNLIAYSYTRSAPTVTRAIVAGGGEGVDRTIRVYADTQAETEWGVRVEAFVDRRDTTNEDELQQAGEEALADGAQTVRLTSTTIDIPDLRFGRDFGLGDKVTVVPLPGEEVAEIVREVTRTATPQEGLRNRILIGSPDATSDPTWIQTVRQIDTRLSHIETR